MQEWISILGGITGLLSLCVSFYTLWKQRLRLTVDWPTNLSVVSPDAIRFGETVESIKTEVIFMGELKIVNPSPNDIGYFDLRAFDATSNRNCHIITRNALPNFLMQEKVCYLPQQEPFLDFGTVCSIPSGTNGILPKHSFTTLTVLIYTFKGMPLPDNLVISFKVPVWAFWWDREPMSDTSRRKYKAFRKVFRLTGWENVLASYKVDKHAKNDNC